MSGQQGFRVPRRSRIAGLGTPTTISRGWPSTVSPFVLCKKEFYTCNFALIFHQFLGKAVKVWIGEGGDFFLYGTGIILPLGFIERLTF